MTVDDEWMGIGESGWAKGARCPGRNNMENDEGDLVLSGSHTSRFTLTATARGWWEGKMPKHFNQASQQPTNQPGQLASGLESSKDRAPQRSRRRTGAKCQTGLGCLTSPTLGGAVQDPFDQSPLIDSASRISGSGL